MLLINENDLDYFCDLHEYNEYQFIYTVYENTKQFLKYDNTYYNNSYHIMKLFNEIIVFNRKNNAYTQLDESSCEKIQYFATNVFPMANLTIRGITNGKLCSTSFSRIANTQNLYVSAHTFNVPTTLFGNELVDIISPNIIGIQPYCEKIMCGNIDDLIEYTDKFNKHKYADANGIVHVYIIDETKNISETKVDKLNSNLHNLFDSASTQFDITYYTMVDINGNIIKE